MRIIKKIAQLFIQPVIRKRIHRTSIYTWKDITLHLPPGIFHPAYFFSTKFLLQHLMKKDVSGRSFLELGAGNGLISISAAQRGALVSSSDISVKVIELLKENARSNKVELKVIHSDLFDNIDPQQFSIIAINPPYYPKTPRNEFEQAWYCGENFEYFEKLFLQLPKYHDVKSEVLMVLSEECDLSRIKNIAATNNYDLILKEKKRIYWEMNYIFEIRRA
ncbi:MAG: methyltransferase [Bacteroidetes bacterium]|jgi:release factor glutamine methyltransferase|nr:methyltransferase [Bacteroidota bacterium]